MIIENFTLEEFFKQKPELVRGHITALKFIPASPTKRDVFNMKLRQVEAIKKGFGSGSDQDLINIVSEVQEVTIKEVLKMTIIEFFKIVNSIRNQIEMIVRAEENSLTPSDVNMKWEQVNGSERMAKFGIYNTLESLSGGDALKYREFMEMEYSEIFTILLMRKTASDIQKDMDKIKTN